MGEFMLRSHVRAGGGLGHGLNTSSPGRRADRRLRVKRGASVALAAASALVNVPGASAGTADNWLGGTSAVWDDATNWSVGIPDGSSDVSLPATVPASGLTNTKGAADQAN